MSASRKYGFVISLYFNYFATVASNRTLRAINSRTKRLQKIAKGHAVNRLSWPFNPGSKIVKPNTHGSYY